MTKSFTTPSKIVYDPNRGEMNRRTAWWCVANVDPDITRYCRWWLKREHHIHLQPPAWDAHVSIVRGEMPASQLMHKWKMFHKNQANVAWDHLDIQCKEDKHNGGMFYWINVECPIFDNIRESIGLRVGFRYHITIGRTYEYDARKPR